MNHRTDPQNASGVSRFGLTDERATPLLKVNLKFNRIYFNVFIVRSLALRDGHFKIFRRGTRWLLTKTDSVDGLVLKFYNNAYYVVCKSLVYQLVNYFQHDKLSFLVEGVDQKREYYPLKFFIPDPKPFRQPKEDPQLVSAARTVARFEKTNFPGRVKTKEVIRAEQTLSNNAKL